ncbi:MAG: DUF1566 domain-containing protein [bacterium]
MIKVTPLRPEGLSLDAGLKRHNRGKLEMILAAFAVFGFSFSHAGVLDSPAAPTDPGSAMYTLEDLYNRLDAGVDGTQSVYAGPVAGPGSTGHTLNQIMSKAPTTNADAAGAGQVLIGKTYWGLNASAWGTNTGTMANNGAVTITPSTSAQTIPQGYHNGAGSVGGDAGLVTANIKSGITLFGVAGKSSVVDTASGTPATAADILSPKKAYVNGSLVTGTMASQTLSANNGTVGAGYYGVTTLVAVDIDLVSANIKSGITLFGVAGNVNVVNTSSGDAVAGDILPGKKAWVDGTELTGTAKIAQVAKTAQTTSYAAGDDGDLKRGVAWPSPRFTDIGDGTVTDNLTGLIWLKDANAFGGQTWAQALTDCATLANGAHGLTDGSVAGAWRLPNIRELLSLIDYRRSSPALCNTSGYGQWSSLSPFTGVQSSYYWSSTTRSDNTANAWDMHLNFGIAGGNVKTVSTSYVWPVRGGQ